MHIGSYALQIFESFPQAWFVCGGWAIDLFIGRVSRAHKDVDFAIWRSDQLALQTYLTKRGWTLEKAVAGQLLPWSGGEFIQLPIHTIWCKHPRAKPGFIEILFNERIDGQFLFRRGTSITRPETEAVVNSHSGVPILAPEIVLLYKAKDQLQEDNRHDFEISLPHLNDERRAWLRSAIQRIYPEHEWISRL